MLGSKEEDEYWAKRNRVGKVEAAMNQAAYESLIPSQQHVQVDQAEYAKQLRRILQSNPTMTLQDLGFKLDKSEEWIQEQLRVVENN